MGYLDALKLGEAQWGVVCDLAEGFSGSDSQEADALRIEEERLDYSRSASGLYKSGGRRPRDRRDRLSFLNSIRCVNTPARHGKLTAKAQRWARGSYYKAASSARFLATCGELSRRPPRHRRDVYHATGHARGLGLLEKGDHARPMIKCFVRALSMYIEIFALLSSSPPMSKRKDAGPRVTE